MCVFKVGDRVRQRERGPALPESVGRVVRLDPNGAVIVRWSDVGLCRELAERLVLAENEKQTPVKPAIEVGSRVSFDTWERGPGFGPGRVRRIKMKGTVLLITSNGEACVEADKPTIRQDAACRLNSRVLSDLRLLAPRPSVMKMFDTPYIELTEEVRKAVAEADIEHSG